MSDRKALPKGVGAKSVGKDGREVLILDPHQRNMRWPGLHVDSSRFKGLPVHERLHLLSGAYLQAAIALCEAAGGAGGQLDWPAASVCLYCKFLGSELFLKACITRLDDNKIPKDRHNLSRLLRRYRELLPDPQYDFPIGPTWRPADIKGLTGIDQKPDEVLRYSADMKGTASSLTHLFAPGYQLNVLRDLHQRASRIWSSLPTKSGR